MQKLSREKLVNLLKDKKPKEKLLLKEIEVYDMDFANWDLSNIDFSFSAFHNVNLDYANLEFSNLSNVFFDNCTLRNANLENANLESAMLRGADMTSSNIKGANLYAAVLEDAKLDNIISDKNTKWFDLRCPEEGAFLGYKKCFNNKLVQLLIPADAKRSSATLPSCRCDKAKILTIKSFDYKENYTEASSLVDEEFIYRVGEWLEAENFNEDRWRDSTTGIHFWMTREEAKNY